MRMPNLNDLDDYIKSLVIGTDKCGFVLNGPETNTLEITTHIGCINNCSYCPQDKIISSYKKRSNIMVMDMKTYESCLSKVKGKDLTIIFTGFSEPFLHPDIMKMIQMAHNFGFKIILSTTLKGFESSYITELEKIPFEIFWVHLPSQEPLEGILNGMNIEKYRNDLSNLIKSNISQKSFHYHGSSVNDVIKDIVGNIAKVIPTYCKSGMVDDIKDEWKTNKRIGSVICNKKFICPVLLPNGELTLCCCDCKLEHILGNLLEEEWDDIYKKDIFWNVIVESKKESGSICHGCHYSIPISSLKQKNRKIKVN